MSATMTTGSSAIDARLNLSLDDLIKERKKEVKQKKRESVKETPKQNAQQNKSKKQQKTANAQADKRAALKNKNRGLPTTSPKQKENSSNNGAGMSAKALRRKKQREAKKTARAGNSPKNTALKQKQQPKKNKENAKNNNNTKPTMKQQKNKKQQQFKQPTLSPKQSKAQANATVTKLQKKLREVVKFKKGQQLQITLTRTKADVRRMHKKTQQQKQVKLLKPKATKVLLPGKSQPKTMKKVMMAQKIVKKAKAQRKVASSNGGKFTVRKPVMVRKVRK